MTVFRVLGAGCSVFFQFLAVILSAYLIVMVLSHESRVYKEKGWGESKRNFLLRPPVLRSAFMIIITLITLGVCIYGASGLLDLFINVHL